MIKILLICSEARYFVQLEEILKESIQDAEINRAFDCKSAVNLASKNHFETIILMVPEPISQSFEICQQLKTGINITTPLIISISNSVKNDDRIKWIESGADGFIGFPADRSDVLTQVKALLRLKFLENKFYSENQKTKDFFFELNKSLNTTDTMFEFLKALQQNLNTLLDASNFYVALYNILDDSLSLPFFQDENDNFEHISIEKTLASLVIRSKKSYLLSKEQILEKIRLGEVELIGTLANSWLGTPLILKNKLIGMMAVQSYSSSSVYTHDDIKLMEFLAIQVAVLIERKDNEVKLRNALSKAEEGERLKSAFLANLSHEIRTPMNAIMGFSSLLDLEDISKEEKTTFISLITENGNALLKMIDDLVDISKIETGDLTIQKIETNVISLLNDIYVENFEKIEKQKKSFLQLKLSIDPKVQTLLIETDPFRVKQILNNLIDNAIKFTEEGQISFGFTINDNSYIDFFVKDTGMGIKQENQKMIFEKFRQIEMGDVRIFGGNGLGLNICKYLVELLGGKISVSSVFGYGSEFRFNILAEKSKFEEAKNKKNRKFDYNWENKTILVADDVLSNYQYLNVLLKISGAEILWAKNGKEAVEIVAQNSLIDLILMDIQMPILNGFQASRLIKQNHSYIPIIALTAFAELTEEIELKNSGFDDYISKPIKPDVLLQRIDSWI